MKAAVCGKGGSGKSTITTLLAKELAKRERKVLVIDSDESNYGLSRQLGVELPMDFTAYFGGKQKALQDMIFVWEPLCGIYGYGAAGCYIGAVLLKKMPLIVKFLSFSFIGTAVEFAGGFLLDHGLHMRAWDYSGTFINISGYVNLKMAILWGILGVLFSYLLPVFEKIFEKMRGKIWRVTCAGLTIFLVADMVVTSMCLVRWRDRHEGILADNWIERTIDDRYPDEVMEKRFCNWHFIDEKGR